MKRVIVGIPEDIVTIDDVKNSAGKDRLVYALFVEGKGPHILICDGTKYGFKPMNYPCVSEMYFNGTTQAEAIIAAIDDKREVKQFDTFLMLCVAIANNKL